MLPNVITCTRIAFAFPLFFLCLDKDFRWLALCLFLIGMLTDGLDGFIARKYNSVSKFGALLDPIADKILVASVVLPLCILGEIPWWVFVVIFLREVSVTIFRLIVAKRKVISANTWGKAKTVVQTLAFSVALLPIFTAPDQMYSSNPSLSDYVGELGDSVIFFPPISTGLSFVRTGLIFAAVFITACTGIVYCVAACRFKH
ncbi:CDP-diacylglycerol--glycerol-3-phosphate 3-phosphatidyltransferase [Tropheryma whipplei]|uniref:CDP-diacylglycerol--glycerol-3-phosphate 3-phosphatidyltransferase n=1 Tax=Tropheryma whipplei TaxID=2039 RepID=UPI0004BBC629|nr:CDP-diacylglycerol--glycerol-3-phosphate 3-phosphatidyltransferase [Tropheryma whipplei]